MPTNAKKRRESPTIKNDLINIAMPIENPTSPSLYSLFHGLRNVRTKSGREKSCKNAVLTDIKYAISPRGASKNQNCKNKRGRVR